MIIKNKNLHFENEQDNHMSSESHEENSCDLNTNLLIVSTNRMFNILREAGVDFRPTYITAHLHLSVIFFRLLTYWLWLSSYSLEVFTALVFTVTYYSELLNAKFFYRECKLLPSKVICV